MHKNDNTFVQRLIFMKFILFVFLLLTTTIVSAQPDSNKPPYQRYPTIPGLQLLTTDSTQFTKDDLPKKKQVLVMLFSPDCDHCQHEAEQIVANKEGFEKTQILMVSTYPLFRLKEFAQKYGLNEMENVTITKDPSYTLLSFYDVRTFPYLALYNKKGELLKVYKGSVEIDKVLQAFKEDK